MPNSHRRGRGRGYLLLLHPGPSAVCTLVTVASGWSAWHQGSRDVRPELRCRRRLALAGAAMALAQVSTGMLNDAFDAPWDRLYQPYKPIPTGVVPRTHAWLLGLASGGGALLCARGAGRPARRLMFWGLASGWSYSLGLSRTPLSFLPFAGGLVTVPLLGPAAVGVPLPGRGQLAVIAAGVGLGLHLANGGPDIERDRLAGRRSLPVLLGESGSRDAGQLLLGAGALAVAAASPRRGRGWALAGAAACLGLVSAERLLSPRTRAQGRHPFVIPVLAGGALGTGWLMARSRGGAGDHEKPAG